MRNFLFLFMFVISTAAFAGTDENNIETGSATEKTIDGIEDEIIDHNGGTENDTIKTRKKPVKLTKELKGDGSRFDISILIVDFINRNNIKIAKRILKE
ncbi:hypothetical protein [Flavobacterium litorale]|uniref:Uncharacterized protein n=1 Tax=Flavobacterium litorale TaxID=2856519 RepID=A0ABX8V3B8_9FLAO|nr:hypothetical protein [Flavobacterium litorale]QYJ67336.1 hypothetical protein K1I41_07095 [Flavobacterium litorale]